MTQTDDRKPQYISKLAFELQQTNQQLAELTAIVRALLVNHHAPSAEMLERSIQIIDARIARLQSLRKQ